MSDKKTYDQATLQTIEDCGKCLFTLEEVAIIVEADETEFKKLATDKKSDVYKRYNKGKYTAELEVRIRIYNLAIQGSSQAQEHWNELREKLRIHEA